MKIETVIKESFAVIGKEGSTLDGPGFVQALWQEANAHFPEVASLAKKKENGNFAGFWGAMSDFSRAFQPWEDGFSKGFYLAGAECPMDSEAPAGWVKWIIPGFEYRRAECGSPTLFADMLAYLEANSLALAGAVQDFTDPENGKNYMYFPIRTL